MVVTEFNVSISGYPEPAPPTPAQETQGRSWRSLEEGPVSFESPHLPKGPYPSLVTVSRVGDRAAGFADLLTVSETANEPPQDEGNSFNSPRNLAMEATYINHNFSQQCLRMVRS